MQRFEGKTVVITGGNSGIGLATAQRFAAEGARVFIAGRREAELQAAVRQIGHGAQAIQADVTRGEDLAALYATVKERAGVIDVLVAASGVSEHGLLDDTTEAHFDYHFDINVRGLVFTVQGALPLMPAGSAIVLIGSIAGSIGNAGYGTYSATKAAVRSYTRTWSKELAARGIRINTLSPGPIETPMFDSVTDEIREQFTQMVPLKRMGKPEEIAGVALFLASADSAYITGAELVADGGMIA
ncbi:SDR family NAD(P)-dependent oxidoreductase [Amantichitinum ursilacus]|uniref:3-oxoacyl-[acyl-carrier-protein] reductase FabG n=1 Tax=Amantichitinum ursilacus TaxID=857265 RepID=A0A0N0XMH3_9NEIS|nr:SDR family oxidoreductase [Amantichitinum ursilacus]KPC54166.1 3-oxoacyl-[acyl-carrier-protein] reductase FabG [Amantichitinum ursilacus]